MAPLSLRRRTLISGAVGGKPSGIPTSPDKPRPRERAVSRKRSKSRTSRGRRRRQSSRGRSRPKRGSKQNSKKALLPPRSLSMKPPAKLRSRQSISGSKSNSKRASRAARTSYAPLKAFNPLKRQPLRSPSDQSSGDEGLRSNSGAKETLSGRLSAESLVAQEGPVCAVESLTDVTATVESNSEEPSPVVSVPSTSLDAASTKPKPSGTSTEPSPAVFSPRKILKRPRLSSSLSVPERLAKIQNFIENFEYNFDSRAMFISKSRPLSSISECAEQIIRKSSPIKCMEAVVLGICLTNDIDKLSRFCLRFKSTVEGLFDLVTEFRRCYVEECGHVVHRMTVGLPVGQSHFSKESIHWQYLDLPLDNDFFATESDLLRELLDKFVARSWEVKYALDYGGPIPVIHPDLEATRQTMRLRPKDIRDLRKDSQTMLINRANLRERKTRHHHIERSTARTKKVFLRAHSQSRSLSPQKSTRRIKTPSTGLSCPRVRTHSRPRTQAGGAFYTPRLGSGSRDESTPRARGHMQRVSPPVVLPALDAHMMTP